MRQPGPRPRRPIYPRRLNAQSPLPLTAPSSPMPYTSTPPPSTPDRYPPPDAFGEIVDVVVGQSETFKLHKGVLCFYSGFFDRALNGRFKEAGDGVVRLTTEEVDIFRSFVAWLYTKRFADEANDGYLHLCKLWAFADRREIPLLMNVCIDAIRERNVATWSAPDTVLHFVYKNTIPEAGLRRLLITLISKASGSGLLTEQTRGRWPADALWDVLKATWNENTVLKASSDEIEELDLCQFHQHEEGVTCQKSK